MSRSASTGVGMLRREGQPLRAVRRQDLGPPRGIRLASIRHRACRGTCIPMTPLLGLRPPALRLTAGVLAVARAARRRPSLQRWGTLVVLAGGLLSCQLPDRYLIYPKAPPVHVQTWTDTREHGPLRLHLVWAKPVGAGPWPTVLVHPDGSATATDMRGVLWALARQGYLAVAVDYRRLHDGTYQRTLFPWCEAAEMLTVLEVLRTQPGLDGQRLAALGFSQG